MFATVSAILSLAFEITSKALHSAFFTLSAFLRMTVALVKFGMLLSLVAMSIRLVLHMTGILPA